MCTTVNNMFIFKMYKTSKTLYKLQTKKKIKMSVISLNYDYDKAKHYHHDITTIWLRLTMLYK